MAAAASLLHAIAFAPSCPNITKSAQLSSCNLSSSFKPNLFTGLCKNLSLHGCRRSNCENKLAVACLPSNSSPSSSTRLYVSGLSFRTTQESLRNAFQNFGELKEVKLVMDKIANRPRGFAFLRYATEEESKKAIEGMHGKFLDGRVIFVEVAKPRSELLKGVKQTGY